jgi:predicted transposase YdaD
MEGRIVVTQDSQKHPLNDIPQVYDSTLKQWITQQTSEILPVLLPGAIYEATLNVEVIVPTKRVDKVFKILYDGQEQILHIEFETGYDDQLKSRLLVYNANFYRDYHLPVITIVIYPFQVTMAVPPLHIPNILTFHFQTLPLFEQNAEDIVRQHITCMYPVVPTMQNVHDDLIAQVIGELEELYQVDKAKLSDAIVWMRLLLERSDTVSSPEKEQIEKRLSMYNELWDNNPMVQKTREQGRQEGIQEGRQEGRQEGLQEGLQRSLVTAIRIRFPDLAEFAQYQVSHFDKPDVLESLLQQVMVAPDVTAVLKLLRSAAKL